MDYITVISSNNDEVVIALDHVVSFCDEGNYTRIDMDNASHVYTNGNITKHIREHLRKSNYQIVKIGD